MRRIYPKTAIMPARKDERINGSIFPLEASQARLRSALLPADASLIISMVTPSAMKNRTINTTTKSSNPPIAESARRPSPPRRAAAPTKPAKSTNPRMSAAMGTSDGTIIMGFSL
ncbi:Uncharacterised protein [uncultured archaeon]|nr:Uncharacterised protein [uncultured archaeon]